MKRDREISEFWRGVEREHQGKVCFKTYAILLGRSSDTAINLSGLFYVIDHTVVFENFEKRQSGFLFFGSKEKFEKVKMSFSVEDVIEIKEVTPRTAHRCIRGSVSHSETIPIKSYERFLSRGICQIRLRGDYSLFFDLLDTRNFICYIQDY